MFTFLLNFTQPDSYWDYEKSLLKFAYENELTVLLQIKEIPIWLMNNTSGLCVTATTPNCLASNYTKYANIIYDATKRITNDFEYIGVLKYELLNEPDNNWDVSVYIEHFNNTYNAK